MPVLSGEGPWNAALCRFVSTQLGLCRFVLLTALLTKLLRKSFACSDCSTMPLQAAVGAKGSVLTRFIKPQQLLPNDNRDHRSNVVVRGWYANKSGTVYYKFRLEEGQELCYAAARYVRILVESYRTAKR